MVFISSSAWKFFKLTFSRGCVIYWSFICHSSKNIPSKQFLGWGPVAGPQDPFYFLSLCILCPTGSMHLYFRPSSGPLPRLQLLVGSFSLPPIAQDTQYAFLMLPELLTLVSLLSFSYRWQPFSVLSHIQGT